MHRPARVVLSLAAACVLGVLAVGSAESEDGAGSASVQSQGATDLEALTLDQAKSRMQAAGWQTEGCGDYDEGDFTYFDCGARKGSMFVEVDRTIWSSTEMAESEGEPMEGYASGWSGKASLVIQAYDLATGESLSTYLASKPITRSQEGLEGALGSKGVSDLDCDYSEDEDGKEVTCEGRLGPGQPVLASMQWGPDASESAMEPSEEDGTFFFAEAGMDVMVVVHNDAEAKKVYDVVVGG